MVDKPGVLIDADMCFIAKVPLVTVLDRMRFGVTLSVSIFCRGGRCNEGRIDYSALFEYEVMLTYQKTCAIMMTTSTKGAN